MNYIETLRKQDINISSSGDNIVITPGQGEMPAAWSNSATYIAIDFISFVPNAGVIVQFYNGTVAEGRTTYGGPLNLQTAQTLTWENAMHNEHGVITLSPNKSFVINLNGAVQVSGVIRYRVVQES